MITRLTWKDGTVEEFDDEWPCFDVDARTVTLCDGESIITYDDVKWTDLARIEVEL